MNKWVSLITTLFLGCFIVVSAQADASIFENHLISNLSTPSDPAYTFTLNYPPIDPNSITVKILDFNNNSNPILLTESLHYIITRIPSDLYRITILTLPPGLAVPTGLREDYTYQAEYTIIEPLLDIFAMAVGNKWRYEGTDAQGQPLSVERNITSIDQNSFAAPVFVYEIKENGIFLGTEYYETDGDQIKLWGASYKDEGVVYDLSFSQGLVAVWAPLFVGDHNYSTASVTIAQYPGYTFDTGLTVDIERLETVTLDFATFQAYKVNYTLTVWGYGVYISDSFSWWIVPYLGVVKDEHAGSSLKLNSFSIGEGTISEKSDADNDGLIDFLELIVHQTNWLNADTDGDGMPDGWEVDYDLNPIVDDSSDDPDNDGLNNRDEFQRGSDPHDPDDPCLYIDYLVINPHFSALTSFDTDRVVFFNSSQSTCFEMVSCIKQDRVCTDEWNFGEEGCVVGGNGDDIVVYRYDIEGDYIASLTMTEQSSGATATENLTVTAEIVETPLPAIDFFSSIDNATVTLSVTDLDSSDAAIESVIVFWGDRYRTEYIWPLSGDIEHTYTRTGSEYHIRVKVILTDGGEFNYTFMADEDLTVSIPCSSINYHVVNPQFSALPSSDTDRVVFFNSSQSTCFEMVSCIKQDRVCAEEWNFGGAGDIVGGNGDDIIVYQYDASGDYTASLTMTEQDSGTTATDYLTVTAEIVETPLPAIDFFSSIDNATVTLSVTDLDSSDAAIESVIVFWGDRYRTEYIWPLSGDIEHTYTRTGS
ncbi:hypothetical protein KAR91_30695, partial [Candidatus Pacearchaeota archaeon]|nr:hypothetical protein [Candidatus Pacearchaeota archaeon]